MKKRITVLLLAVCFMIQSFGVWTVQAQPQQNWEEAQERLLGLGIIDETKQAEETVTRGEFAVLTAMLMNMKEAPQSSQPVFADVSAQAKHFEPVMFLYNRNIVSGADGLFRPDDMVTLQEAAAMLVKAAGWDVLAVQRGGYPAGYLNVAAEKELIPPGMSGEGLVWRDAVRMIDSAKDVPMMVQDTYSGGGASYRNDDETTVLSYYHKIKEVRGILNSVGNRSLYEDGGAGEGKVKIDGNTYTSDKVDYRLLGSNVRAWYHMDEDLELIYAQAYKSSVLEISGEDIVSVKDGRLTYYKTAASKAGIAIPKTAAALYNYNYTASFGETELLNASKVILTDNGDDGSYDVVNIIVEEQYFVNQITPQAVYDKYGQAPIDRENDLCDYKLYTADGQEAGFSKISVESVLSVVRDLQNENCIIIICDEQATGKVQSVSSADDLSEAVYRIGGKEYKLAENAKYIPNLNAILSAGNGVTLYLNYSGKIAGAQLHVQDSDVKFGYLIRATYDTDRDYAVMKLYTQNGQMVTADVSQRVRLNDTRIEDPDVLINTLKNLNMQTDKIKQLIRYQVNKDGEISKIQTPEFINDDDLFTQAYEFTRYKDMQDVYYSQKDKAYPGNVRVDENTLIFYVPKSDAYDNALSCYAVKPFREFGSATHELVETYNIAPDKTAGVLVIRSDNGSGYTISGNTGIIAVSDLVQEVDEEGIVRTKLTGFLNGAKVEYFFAGAEGPVKYFKGADGIPVATTVEKGDLIRIGTDSDGYICDYHKIFSLRDRDDAAVIRRGNESTNKKFYIGSVKNLIAFTGKAPEPEQDVRVGRIWQTKDNIYWFTGVPFSVEFGIVKEIHDNIMLIDTYGGTEGDHSGKNFERYLNLKNRRVYILDEVKDEVRLGTVEEVVSAQNAGELDASRVIYACYNDVPSFLAVVIRK